MKAKEEKTITAESALKQMQKLAGRKLNLKSSKEPNTKVNAQFVVVFTIPVDPDTDEYIIKFIQAATIVGACGLEVEKSDIVLPACMLPAEPGVFTQFSPT